MRACMGANVPVQMCVCASVSCAYLNEFYINTESNLERQKVGEKMRMNRQLNPFLWS